MLFSKHRRIRGGGRRGVRSTTPISVTQRARTNVSSDTHRITFFFHKDIADKMGVGEYFDIHYDERFKKMTVFPDKDGWKLGINNKVSGRPSIQLMLDKKVFALSRSENHRIDVDEFDLDNNTVTFSVHNYAK